MNPFSSSEGLFKAKPSCKLPSKTVVKPNVIAKHEKKTKQI